MEKSEVHQKFGKPGEVMDDPLYADIYNDLGIYFLYDLESNTEVKHYCVYTGVHSNKQEIVQYDGDVFGFRLGDNKKVLKKLKVKLKKTMRRFFLGPSDLFALDCLEAQYDNHRILIGLFAKEVMAHGKKFEAGSIGYITVEKYKKNKVYNVGGGGGGPNISYENLIKISKQLKKEMEFEDFKKIWNAHCKDCDPHFISVDRDHAYISNDNRLKINVKYKQAQGEPVKIKSFQIIKK